jgi:hypothetical protein
MSMMTFAKSANRELDRADAALAGGIADQHKVDDRPDQLLAGVLSTSEYLARC